VHEAGAMRMASAFVFLWMVGCTAVPVPLPSPTGGGSTASDAGVAADVIRGTNDARARNALAPLATSAKLMEAARLHALQMARYQRAEHTISGAAYPTMQSRLDAVAYPYTQAAENVAWNQQSAEAVMASWLNSSGHRANIMDPGLTEIGAAMARSAKGEPYWIQVFGRPR
jgi:uncharacterized protein YkwD